MEITSDHEGSSWTAGGFLVQRTLGGYSVEGPGFYIWDDDLISALRCARLLTRGHSDLAEGGDGGAGRLPTGRDRDPAERCRAD